MRPLFRALPEHSRTAQSRATLWLATELAFLVLAAALAVALYQFLPGSWSPWESAPPQWVVALAIAVAAMALLLTRGISGAHRLGDAGAGPEDAARAADPTGGDAAPDPRELAAKLRALQGHVRSLEEALELETHRVAELQAMLDTGHGEAVGEGLRRVRSTVRGLARRTEGDEAATQLLARVETALDRLSTSHDFARPVLARAGVGSAPSPGELLMHGRHPDLGRHPATPGVPAGPLSTGVGDESAEPPDADERRPGAGAADHETVLPVPPRQDPEAGSGHRGRRWFRRHAA